MALTVCKSFESIYVLLFRANIYGADCLDFFLSLHLLSQISDNPTFEEANSSEADEEKLDKVTK